MEPDRETGSRNVHERKRAGEEMKGKARDPEMRNRRSAKRRGEAARLRQTD